MEAPRHGVVRSAGARAAPGWPARWSRVTAIRPVLVARSVGRCDSLAADQSAEASWGLEAVADVTGPNRPVDVPAALRLASSLGVGVPDPGHGTAARWTVLATLGAADLTTARVVEPHLDALAILAEAGRPDLRPPGTTWGVYAAEQPGSRLRGHRDAAGCWQLVGTKPWCSLAGQLSRALITAGTGAGVQLFAIDLQHPRVHVPTGRWHARGLVDVPSGPVELDGVPAEPVGGPGWYSGRDGFAYGGMGVAACWYGAAVALARSMLDAATKREPDQVALLHLGSVDLELTRTRHALAEAAAAVDSGTVRGLGAARMAGQVRSIAAEAAESVLSRVGHALGPGPLTADAAHARRVADLTVYLRQHHAERDVARLGQHVLTAHAGGCSPW
ncbi:MAG: acyl-CoA dehydrogenase [Angustibacter sp.]